MLTPGVDTYATTAELQARAAEYGGTLPPDTEAQEVLLRRAAEAMNAWAWVGRPVSAEQPLAWPRADVPGVACDAVPMAVKQAQCALAIEIHADDLDPPEARRGPVVREKVDALEVAYAEPPAARRRRPASLVLAAPYLRPARVQAVRT
ncbi:DnaT-like ssDNA-binding protein [[Pseudomonas] boreopolis]|uniref:DnaT-like ssDNA-binding protein n=1 Tax=Xanthomonas boreopolis TaxID=86183 RepID=UPI003D46E930